MIEVNPAGQRKLIIAAVVVAALLVVGGVVLLFMQSQSEVVALSDGHQIHLGETRAELEKTLGSDAVKVKPEVYSYPSKSRPVEALIYMNSDKVSGVMVSRNTANKLKKPGISLGSTVVSLEKKFGKKLLAVDTASDIIKQDAYRVDGSKSTSYFVIATCPSGKSTNVTAMAVVVKGEDSELTSLARPRNCTAATTTTVPATTTPAKK